METVVILRNLTTGEVMVVADPEGYDENVWEVLGIDRPPLQNEVWDEVAGGWVVDQEAERDREDDAEFYEPARRRRIFRRIRQEILDIKARLDALEGN